MRAARGGSLDISRLAKKAYEMGADSCHPPKLDMLNLRDLRRNALVEALRASGGNQQKAAELLGIGKTTVYRLAAEYGIEIKNRAGACCPLCGHKTVSLPKEG